MTKNVNPPDLSVLIKSLIKETQELKTLYRELLIARNPPEFLRANETCRMLRISANTLRALRRNKTITCSKIGQGVYYRLSDIRKIMEANNLKNQ